MEEAGEETFRKLMLLELADAYAHNLIDIVRERIRVCDVLAGDYSRLLGDELFAQ
jgi:hypothetical protein